MVLVPVYLSLVGIKYIQYCSSADDLWDFFESSNLNRRYLEIGVLQGGRAGR